jgi:starch-binding outer membrane protein, SusD/RagB family
MKTKNIVFAALAGLTLLTGCSDDFLNRPPKDAIVDVNFYKTDAQLLAGTADLYSAVWKNYADQSYYKIGDIRAGLVTSGYNNRDFVTFNVTGLSGSNVSAYQSFYDVVGQANTVMHNINAYAGGEVTEDAKNYALAEARFMRATAYSLLVMTYGDVPIIEDNIALLNNAALKRNTVESVWEFIRRDYWFAIKNLSEDAPQVGRLTKWSAEGMLARTYLAMAGISGTLDNTMLDSAKYYADRVITMSGKSLLTNYADLFIHPYDNNNESLFELEWVYTPDERLSYKYANTMISQITPSGSISANGDGWGGDIGASSWALSLYDGLFVDYVDGKSGSPGFTLDQRLKSTFMLPGFKYPELGANDDSFLSSPDKAVKYNPSNVTNNDPTTGSASNYAFLKKYVVGNLPGESGKQNYPNDMYMLRLAEMYLIYAEAQILIDGGGADDEAQTSDGKALTYFNAVHMRAGLPEHTGALTWKEVFEEGMKEFAMEGKAWYDMVRRHYYNKQSVYDIINDQDRGLYVAVPNVWPNPTGWSFYKKTDFSTTDVAPASDVNFILPLPQVELSQAPSLNDPAVPYDFN